jgi:hypothetical protein
LEKKKMNEQAAVRFLTNLLLGEEENERASSSTVLN